MMPAPQSDHRPPILFVALQTGAGANGGIASLDQIVRSLDRFRPILVTNRESRVVEGWRAAGLEVHVVEEHASRGLRAAPGRAVLTYVRYAFAVRALIAKTGAQIVHANDPLAFQLSYGGVRMRPGTHIVFNVRDTLDPDRRVPTTRWGWMFKAASHIFFLSKDMQDRWAAIVPLAGEKSSATYSIVDLDQFKPAFREADRKIVLVSGVISPKKGQLRYLEHVAPQLAALGIETWLCGDVAPNSDLYAQACFRAAERLGDMVRFLGYRADMPELMQRAHVVCVPSRHEGLMRTMIEAMAAGCPVVSTDVASARELLEAPGEPAGIVVPIDFQDEMAESLIRLCRDGQLSTELGRNGKTIANVLFQRERVINAYQGVYDQLLAGRADPMGNV